MTQLNQESKCNIENNKSAHTEEEDENADMDVDEPSIADTHTAEKEQPEDKKDVTSEEVTPEKKKDVSPEKREKRPPGTPLRRTARIAKKKTLNNDWITY